MSSPSLKGQAALVTGSTSGIGLGIARALAAAGADIMLNGFGDAAEIERLRQGLEQEFAIQARYSGADLSKPAEIEMLCRTAVEAFGKIDILVNNAGIQHVSAIESFPPEKWDQILAINLSGAFHTIRHLFAGMKDRGHGRILNIASAHALVASPFKSAYVAAKHGIAGLTKVVALEGADHGIRCNAICPGYVWTPLVEKQIPATAKERGLTEEQVIRDVLLHAQPTHQFSTVEQLGALAVFLCGPGGDNITGIILPVDGGWTAQ